MQLGFYFNADSCIGCRACAAACKDKNDLAIGKKFRRVYDYAGGGWSVEDGVCTYEDVFVYSLSTSCNHCENPICVANCPTGAMTKRPEDGVVYVREELCVGCKMCVMSCPYHQPRYDEARGCSTKCDLCRSLIDAGENPACVDACVTRALQWGDIEELRKQYGDCSWIAPLEKDLGTHPSVVFTPSRMNPDGALEGTVTNEAEELL